MPPFIKFTEESETHPGKGERLVFVNASEIFKAVYSKDSDELQIVMSADPNKTAFRLKGKQAENALEVLKTL